MLLVVVVIVDLVCYGSGNCTCGSHFSGSPSRAHYPRGLFQHHAHFGSAVQLFGDVGILELHVEMSLVPVYCNPARDGYNPCGIIMFIKVDLDASFISPLVVTIVSIQGDLEHVAVIDCRGGCTAVQREIMELWDQHRLINQEIVLVMLEIGVAVVVAARVDVGRSVVLGGGMCCCC